MDAFNEARFLAKIDSALNRITTILDNTRAPLVASKVSHSYDDKYLLAEFITNTSSAAVLNFFEFLGADNKQIIQMKKWSDNKSVTLRFQCTEKCKFNRKEERKVESKSQNVTEIKSIVGKATITDKVVTTVRDYFYDFDSVYEINAFPGNTPDDKIVITTRTCHYEIKTSSDVLPKPSTSIVDPIDVNISWLLVNINDNLQTNFFIDRKEPSCHTPRRNNPITNAFNFYHSFYTWSSSVQNYFNNRAFPIQTNHGLDLSIAKGNKIFVPVVPLLENRKKENENEKENENLLLSVGDINEFLNEQKKGIQSKFDDVTKAYPQDKDLITPTEAKILVLLTHYQEIAQNFVDGIDYIEKMLRDQLIAAIGKEISSQDFSEYMIFHNRKLFNDTFKPQQFCYAVRRPEHYPEGVVSIFSDNDESIYTSARCLQEDGKAMKFAINAATEVQLYGEQFVHAWVDHCFSNNTNAQLKLKARARQFSSFILVIGTVISKDQFDPKHAIIIKNKDDILIPLLLEQIPTPKAFRDAIESLSPEQQDFAKAFRSMQLASTLFGICIIQIKPQLERLLNLPDDSLTKEIKLTQDLMELFIEYQIPSDLLSFESDVEVTRADKLNYVKTQVKTMQDMIAKAKQKDLDEEKQKAQYQQASIPTYMSYAPTSPMNYMSNSISYGAPPPPMQSAYGGAPPPPMQSMAFGAPPPPSAPSAPSAPSPTPSAPPPPSSTPQVSKPEVSKPEPKDESIPDTSKADENASMTDLTKIPNILNRNIDLLDVDAALHSTIIKAKSEMTRKFQKSLLASPEEESLQSKQVKKEKNIAFDLLDALSKSGALPIYNTSFHVIIATTHCFDKTLIDTVVQDNINPIEKVERSMLIVTSTIHEEEPSALIKEEHLERVTKASPKLFGKE